MVYVSTPDHLRPERRILSSVSDCLLNVSKDALHSRLLIAKLPLSLGKLC
jgi:hypothetical protein